MHLNICIIIFVFVVFVCTATRELLLFYAAHVAFLLPFEWRAPSKLAARDTHRSRIYIYTDTSTSASASAWIYDGMIFEFRMHTILLWNVFNERSTAKHYGNELQATAAHCALVATWQNYLKINTKRTTTTKKWMIRPWCNVQRHYYRVLGASLRWWSQIHNKSICN